MEYERVNGREKAEERAKELLRDHVISHDVISEYLSRRRTLDE